MTSVLTSRRRTTRIAAAIAAVLGLAVTASACGSSSADDAASGSGSKLTTITIATPMAEGTAAAIPYWLGEKLGYFKQEGLNVKVVYMAGQPAAATGLVAAGRADLVTAVPDTILVPASKGQNEGLKWVFTPYQSPSLEIAVPEDSPIKSAKDLVGKTVGMSATGAPFETFARANVSADGGDGSTLKPVVLPVSAAMEALRKGTIDADVANVSEIPLAASASGEKVRALPLPASVAKTFAAGFLVRDDASAAQMDAYGRYIRAYMEAATFAQENPDAAIKMNWDKYPASKTKGLSEDENMAQAKTVLLATVNQFKRGDNGQYGYLAPERWTADIAYLGLTGKIKDPSSLYDNSLLKTINDFDETAVKKQADDWKD